MTTEELVKKIKAIINDGQDEPIYREYWREWLEEVIAEYEQEAK